MIRAVSGFRANDCAKSDGLESCEFLDANGNCRIGSDASREN